MRPWPKSFRRRSFSERLRSRSFGQTSVVMTGQLLVLLVGNSGPSMAHNVKAKFDPAPPAKLAGRTMEWVMGAAHDTVDWDARNECKVRIEADGPFGPVEPVDYVIIINDLKGSRAAPLRAIALELQGISKGVDELNESVKKQRLASRILPQSRNR
jgi:hypothetical protein